MKRPVGLLVLLFLLAGSTSLNAQGFGTAIAVGEDEVVAGEPLTTAKPGTVYVYRSVAGTWTEVAQLVASDGEPGDHFGHAIATQGSTLVIGATSQDEGTGAAYFFEKDPTSGMWTETTRAQPSDLSAGDAFGSVAAFDSDFALIASQRHNGNSGAVYVFHRNPSGTWSEYGKLVASDADSNDWFGGSVALDGDIAMVGTYRKNRGAGAVYVFRHDSASRAWREEAKLTDSDISQNSRFGTTVALHGDLALIGAPRHNRFTGALHVYQYDPDSGEWKEQPKLVPLDGSSGSQFGAAVAYDGTELWIGSPGAERFAGRVYLLRRHQESGYWVGTGKLGSNHTEPFDGFASTIAVRGNTAVVSVPREDYGLGTAIIFQRDAGTNEWMESAKVFSEIEGLDPVVGGQVDCTEGVATIFDCDHVDLVAFLPVQAMGGGRGVRVNDVWGWTDRQTGKEYALVARLDGTAFVDISDPVNPVYVGELPRTEGSRGSDWRDIKVYKDHAFIVADQAPQHGVQVFDLTQLRVVRNPPATFTETAHYDGIGSAHNIVINEETGYAFTVGNSLGGESCGGGLHMINIQDPRNPTFAGCFADPSTGRRRTGYTHDGQCVIYRGPDAEHQGKEICFGANETALSVADVTDKNNPVALAMATYPNVGYSHQGWLTEDHRYFFMDDELDEIAGNAPTTRTLIWDVQDLDDPILVKEFFGTTAATDHNLYIRGHYVYQSNYQSGFRVLDISDVENPLEIAYFDTFPYGDEAGMGGAWGNYPFFDSGVIIVTSRRQGLFVLKKRETLVP